MKNKNMFSIMILFLLLLVLIFATPFMDGVIAGYLWIAFLGFVGLIIIIWMLMSILKTPKEDSINNFKNQPVILQILEIIFIASFILELITVQNVKIAGYVLFLILIIKLAIWFFKKEE